MIVLDSNVWIGFLNSNDSLHSLCDEVFTKIADEPILVPDHIITEVFTVLRQKAGNQVAVDFLNLLNSSTQLKKTQLNPTDFENFMKFCAESSFEKLSFTDELMRYIQEIHDFFIITFDKDLQKALNLKKQ
jgi:predicted nucleic acid-binding protein